MDGPPAGGDAPLSGTEGAVFGPGSVAELQAFLSGWAEDRLGSPIGQVRFRAGRIDVVWGVVLADGRAVVLKIHRPPVDVEALETTHRAQRVLADASFPSTPPLAGPDLRAGHVLSAAPLVVGEVPDGRDPVGRRLLAHGLARQVDILRDQADLVARAGRGLSWCHYQDGPWPVPHDTLVDFTETRPGYEWLDELGQRVADQVLAHRDPDRVVVGHADWYAANTAVVDGRLVGTFDWELVADDEAVIAGFAAACYADSSTGPAGLSGADEVAAFLRDYGHARAQPLTPREQRTAAAAAAWIVVFNARWQVGLIDHGLADQATIALARDHGDQLLGLTW